MKANSVSKAVVSFFADGSIEGYGTFASVNCDSQEEHLRNNSSRDTDAARIIEEYITQASQESERKLTKKTFHEMIITNSWILGTLLKLDKFFLISQVLVQSRNFLRISRDTDR